MSGVFFEKHCGTLFYVNIYRSYKLSKNSQVFGPPCIYVNDVVGLYTDIMG